LPPIISIPTQLHFDHNALWSKATNNPPHLFSDSFFKEAAARAHVLLAVGYKAVSWRLLFEKPLRAYDSLKMNKLIEFVLFDQLPFTL